MKKIETFVLALSLLIMPMFMSSCKKAEQKPIGLQLYSIRQDLDSNLTGTLEKVGKMGYKYLESANYRSGLIYGMKPEAFKAFLEKNGMSLISAHVNHQLPDSASWGAAMAWWDTCIAAHVAAGVKYLVQPSMEKAAYDSLPYLEKYCKYFNAVGEKCNAAGLKFGYHNHDKEFGTIGGQVMYDFMLKNTDPSKVFFEMDLWWTYIGKASILEYFQKYPGRFLLLHVKDEYAVGGSGKIDWKSIFDKVNVAGAKYYIVEQEEYQTTALDGIKKSLDYLEKADFVK